MENYLTKNKVARANLFAKVREELSPLINLLPPPEVLSVKDLLPLSSSQHRPLVNLISQDSLSASHAANNPLVLVFASARRAGGGVEGGSVAQEEDVSLNSSWALQAALATSFYDPTKRSSALNADLLLYIPKVLCLSDLSRTVAMVGIAAPNVRGLRDQGMVESRIKKEGNESARHRLAALFELAHRQQHDEVIVGAWGCGVFAFPITDMVENFKWAIQNTAFAGKITFALPVVPESSAWRSFSELLPPSKKHNL